MRLHKTHLEVDERSTVTPYGGLDLAVGFTRRFRVAQRIDEHVEVLKRHLPYYESDHVLALAFSLYVGGTCIEDLANLQHDPAVLRMVGAERLPDPTTAGDFLRRFDGGENPGALAALRRAVDEIQDQIWKRLRRKGRGPRQAQGPVFVDLDGHRKVLYGVQKEGADFSYRGQFSYYPLLVSLAETGESLAVRNRPGNEAAHMGADDVLDELLPRVKALGREVVVRGDSEFDQAKLRQACVRHGVRFAFVARQWSNRRKLAQSLPEGSWRPFRTRAARTRAEQPPATRRKRARDRRKPRARARGYHDLELKRQWVTEVPYQPRGSSETFRLVMRRQRITHRQGQELLFDEYRYRYAVTNLPDSWSAEDVLDATYQRCDQENLIEQMGSGLAMWRMPVGQFAGNSAWLEIARLAWNLGKWIAQLALPAEVVRWEWKRFRQAYVYVAAQVVRRANQTWVRLSGSHRFTDSLVAAHMQLQT